MDCVMYARYSPRPDASECESLAVQLDRCKAYCHMHDLTCVQSFEDPEVSARKVNLADRPQGKMMLDYVYEHGIRHVVMARVDRMFRNALDGLRVSDQLEKRGVQLHFADQGGVSLCAHTAVGRFVYGLLLQMAEFEPAMTAERTSRALRFKQKNGDRVSGHVKYGFMLDPTDSSRTIVNPDEHEVLESMIKMQDRGYAPDVIATWLNSNENFTRSGKLWRTRSVEKILKRQKEDSVYG